MTISSERVNAPSGPAGDKPTNRLAGMVTRSGRESAARIGRYSAFVGVMRYALPLVAVLLLGLVVIWPLASGREDGFRVTYSARVQEDGSLKMLNARYIGTDSQSQPYTVTATEAIPSTADAAIITLKTLAADMFVKDGSWVAVTADEGLYLRTPGTLDLAGSVTVFSDQGHELRTESAHIEINAGTAEGDEPVSGQGPLGLIDGSGFRITERGANILVSGPVKVTIFPKRSGSDAEIR